MKKKPKALIPNAAAAERENTPDNFGDRTGYSYETNLGYQNNSWMDLLKDDTRLSEISIPGTHGSTALHGKTFADEDLTRNQRMSITTQLNSGIRYLDMRVRRVGTGFTMHHGPVYQQKVFGGILSEIVTFLRQNPNETILMRIKEEHDAESGSLSFEEIFKRYWNDNKQYFWEHNADNPKLKDVRGKMVVLQDFESSQKYGIRYKSLNIQDNYDLPINDPLSRDVHKKWLSVKNHLYAASADSNKDKIYLNHLSATSSNWENYVPKWITPWFIASGGTKRDTGASNKSFTTDSGHNYVDYPVIWDFEGGPPFPIRVTFYYEGTNNLTLQQIKAGRVKHTGIIAADFPGSGLIDRIITLNKPFSDKEIQDGYKSNTWKWGTKINPNIVGGLYFKPSDSKILKWIKSYKIQANGRPAITKPRREPLPDGQLLVDFHDYDAGSALNLGEGSIVKVHAVALDDKEIEIFNGVVPKSPVFAVPSAHKLNDWKIANAGNAASGLYFDPVDSTVYSYISSYKVVAKGGAKTRIVNKPAPQSDGRVYLDFAQGDSSYYVQPGESVEVYATINNGTEIRLSSYFLNPGEDAIEAAHQFDSFYGGGPTIIGVYFKAMDASITNQIGSYHVKIYDRQNDETPSLDKYVTGLILSSGIMQVPIPINLPSNGKFVKVYARVKATGNEVLVLDRQLRF
ncbi:phosphatidylinositol-specific phospholipase C [Bacillus cereus]|nr:phosphatidylinositol-specific phospholipase C [Bacillus cereus]